MYDREKEQCCQLGVVFDSDWLRRLLLPFSGQKPRMVLNILPCTGPPHSKNCPVANVRVPRLGIPALEVVMGRNVRVKCFFW